jgi:hypothetical protein
MRSCRNWPNGIRRTEAMPCLVRFQSSDAVEISNIQEAATDCVHKYGNEAALIAWGIADGYALEGDLCNHNAWMLVMDAIELMKARKPGERQRYGRPSLGPRS